MDILFICVEVKFNNVDKVGWLISVIVMRL